LAAEVTAFGESAEAGQPAVRLDESLGLLDALWSGEPVTARGEYLTATDVRMLPRPVPGRGAGQVAPYLEAGLIWWIEALGWWRGSPQDAMNRVRQGPPAVTRHQP
jgi:hypothetical protein